MPNPVILLTGATSGIGRDAAGRLAAAGAEVIVHGRSAGRVRQTVAAIRRATPAARVTGAVADFARRRDVESLATQIRTQCSRLDVLVHNAAVVPLRREVTEDGFERQFAVNHLAPFLLTHRLAPLLGRSAPARVVIVASQLERNGRIALHDLQSEQSYDSSAVYCNTKLANVLFARELARRLAGTGVTSNCLHPGIAGTNLLNALGRKPRWLAPWTRYRQPRPRAATDGIVRLALDESLVGTSGAYFREAVESEPSATARDMELARELWRASAEILGIPDDLVIA